MEENFLQAADPLLFSSSNVLAFKRQVGKGRETIEIKKLIEFITGLPSSFKLTGRFRKWSNVKSYVSQLYVERQFCMTGLRLPIDYKQNGVYKLEACSEQIFEVSIQTGVASTKKLKFTFPLAGQSCNAFELYVEDTLTARAWHRYSMLRQSAAASGIEGDSGVLRTTDLALGSGFALLRKRNMESLSMHGDMTTPPPKRVVATAVL
eukprot:5042064-Amphidinium_carterae.1